MENQACTTVQGLLIKATGNMYRVNCKVELSSVLTCVRDPGAIMGVLPLIMGISHVHGCRVLMTEYLSNSLTTKAMVALPKSCIPCGYVLCESYWAFKLLKGDPTSCSVEICFTK